MPRCQCCTTYVHPCADIPLPPTAQVLADVEEEQKAKEPEKWMELGLQSVG